MSNVHNIISFPKKMHNLLPKSRKSNREKMGLRINNSLRSYFMQSYSGKEDEERPKQPRHPTHEHPLELTILGQGINTKCSGCNMSIEPRHEYYTCRACSYSLHCVCFNLPSSCQHQAERGHDLILHFSPSFQCKACKVQGSGFSYNCNICDNEYHSLCLKRPATVKCSFHVHDLELMFFTEGFKCDVCQAPGTKQWLYRCNICYFDVHLNCVNASPSLPQNPPNLPSQAPFVSPNNSCTRPVASAAPNYVSPYMTPTYAPNVGYGMTNFNHTGGSNKFQGNSSGGGALGVVFKGMLGGIGDSIGKQLVKNTIDEFDS